MSELRECPFCGGTPFLSIVEDVDYAECSNCHVYADVKHWNQRATPAPVASREGWSLTKDDLLRMCADEGDIRRGYREISIAVFEEIRRMALSALSPAPTEADAVLLDATFDSGQLSGTIKGDRKGRFENGERVRTSLVKRIMAYTKNSVYELELRDQWNISGTKSAPTAPVFEEVQEALRVLKLSNEAADCYCEGVDGCEKHINGHALKVLEAALTPTAHAQTGSECECGRYTDHCKIHGIKAPKPTPDAQAGEA